MAKNHYFMKRADEFLQRLRVRVLKPKRQIKDVVFRLIFGKNKKALLELYNALNGTDYTDVNDLIVATLDNAIYVSMKNDLAFLLAGTINMYEHQSTVNPNMPVRFLIYLAQEYQMLIEQTDKSLYGSELITLPTPQCVVFYNGTKETADEQQLCLSSAFCNRNVEPAAEIIVKVININYGHNINLMQGCDLLSQYAKFIEITREYGRNSSDRVKAMNEAIDDCIAQGILEDVLKKHRSQVLGSLLEEFDEKKYATTLREEGREEGRNALAKAVASHLNISVEEVLQMEQER